MKHIQSLKILMVAAAVAAPICLMVSVPAFAAKPKPVCIVGHSHSSIQDAVNDYNCHSINVPAGTFKENVVIMHDVEIRGAGPDSTTIDGSNKAAPVFLVSHMDYQNPIAITLKGITITGGTSPRALHPNGGGISTYGAGLTVKDCVITKNRALDFFTVPCTSVSDQICLGQGGGIGAAHSTVIVTDSIITENTATFGGGLRVAGIGALTVKDSVIESNTASNVGRLGQGGGIWGYAPPVGSMTVKDSLINDNMADTQGGGIYVSNRTLTIKDSDIVNNTAGTGGGIYRTNSALTIKDSTITGNSLPQIAP